MTTIQTKCTEAASTASEFLQFAAAIYHINDLYLIVAFPVQNDVILKSGDRQDAHICHSANVDFDRSANSWHFSDAYEIRARGSKESPRRLWIVFGDKL